MDKEFDYESDEGGVMLRVTFMRKNTTTNVTLYCGAIQMTPTEIQLLHYPQMYLNEPGGPFRVLKVGDFYVSIGRSWLSNG